MNIFRKVFAIIFATSAIATAVVALFLYNIEQKFFNPQFYKNALTGQNAYERIYSILPQKLIKNQSPNRNTCTGPLNNTASPLPDQLVENTPLLLDVPSEELWRQAFTPPEVKKLTEAALDQFFGYIDGTKDTPCLSLAPLKEKVKSLGEQYNGLAAMVPDQFSVIPRDPSSGKDLTRTIRYVRLGLRFSPLIPLICLLLMTLLVFRKWEEWFGRWGLPLLVSGLLTIIFGLWGTHWMIASMDTTLARNPPPNLTPAFHQFVLDLISSLLEQLMKPIYIEAALLGLAGLLLLVVASVLRKKKMKN